MKLKRPFLVVAALGAALIYMWRKPSSPLKGIKPLSEAWLADHCYESGKDGDPQ
jgi:hypothetical protein